MFIGYIMYNKNGAINLLFNGICEQLIGIIYLANWRGI